MRGQNWVLAFLTLFVSSANAFADPIFVPLGQFVSYENQVVWPSLDNPILSLSASPSAPVIQTNSISAELISRNNSPTYFLDMGRGNYSVWIALYVTARYEGAPNPGIDCVLSSGGTIHLGNSSNGLFQITPDANGNTNMGCFLYNTGDGTIEVTGITLIPPAIDLAVSTPQVSQVGAAGSPDDHLIQIMPGTPARIDVPINGSGFNPVETRVTTVTLQAGAQTLSQSINLGDIQSGAVSSVPFEVTFGPRDVGLQTITATIDPSNTLNESNFSNNAASVQVHVMSPYKLVAFFNGSTTPIPDSGGSETLVPSVKSCGQLKDRNDGATDVEIRCVQVGDPTFLPVQGCRFILDLSQGPDSGGHNHNANDESRPFVLDPLSPSFPVGQFLSVDTAGNNLTYTPPEVAGDVFFQVAGTDPNGNQISGPSYLFHIQDTDLGALVSLNGAGASTINPGISVETESHPGAGIYGTQAMQTAVAKMVAIYYSNGDAAGFTGLDSLGSQAGTMVFGGLFDANWNGAIIHNSPTPWSPPHCGHRNGTTIDLSINQLDDEEMQWLEDAAGKAGFIFTNPLESPSNANANHWHAVLKAN